LEDRDMAGDKRVAIVTGAARGIGAAIAERLAADGGVNPAAVVQAVRSLVESGQLARDDGADWRLVGTSDLMPPAGATHPHEAMRRGAKESPGADPIAAALAGRYVVEGVLAKGTVLTTYAARDARGERVELHAPSRHVAAITRAEHFLETIERVAALADPRVVPIIDFGAAGSLPFYVTPLATDATSLRERLARERPLAVGEALRIAGEVACALAHAHARGIRHGDLRPKHVRLVGDAVSLAGLGLVDALAAAGGDSSPEETTVRIGAPAYLSPEQLGGEVRADARSDIYALGCVLYEMLAGEAPFGGSKAGVIARKLTQTAPSVRALRDAVPEALERLIARCLARVPADRYATADELAEALDGVRRGL
jgi:serine/threonine-protein kinase